MKRPKTVSGDDIPGPGDHPAEASDEWFDDELETTPEPPEDDHDHAHDLRDDR